MSADRPINPEQGGISGSVSGMDVSKAQVANLGDRIALEEPGWPFRIYVRMGEGADRPEVLELTVTALDRTEPVTASVLSQLPMRQLASVAASTLSGEGETLYRMLAQPRPHGVRSWPPDHYARVTRVAAWARSVGRPGGAAGAVSEFWTVDYRTARRWLSRAKELGLDGARPSTRTQP